MVDCVGSAQAAVRIGSWDVGLVRGGDGRSKCATIDTTELYGIGQSHGLRVVVLGVVLLLRLRLIAIGAAVSGRCG